MITFQDYINIQEISSDYIKNISEKNFENQQENDMSSKILTASLEAFKAIISNNREAAIQFLTQMASSMPELYEILRHHGLDSFASLNFDINKATKSKEFQKTIIKSFGDLTPNDSGKDVIVGNYSDSQPSAMD